MDYSSYGVCEEKQGTVWLKSTLFFLLFEGALPILLGTTQASIVAAISSCGVCA